MGKRIHKTGRKGQDALNKSAGRMARDLMRCNSIEALNRYLSNKTPEQLRELKNKKLIQEKRSQKRAHVKKLKEEIHQNCEETERITKGIKDTMKNIQKSTRIGKAELKEIEKIRNSLGIVQDNSIRRLLKIEALEKLVPKNALKEEKEKIRKEIKTFAEDLKKINHIISNKK